MYLTSNIPYFKCWVRKEFTHAHSKYHGEYIHGLAVAVTTIPDRCLSFQIIFTGCEAEGEPNPHGGAMWASVCRLLRLWVTSPLKSGPSVCRLIWRSLGTVALTTTGLLRSPGPSLRLGLCKINNEFHTGRYLFTVDYAESDVSEDPSQHKQSHVLVLTDAGKWTGNVVALPNNRVRATSPAYWLTGEGAPDFRPNQWIQCAEQDDSYMDPEVTFNNLYKE
jgi:hypothetical protein